MNVILPGKYRFKSERRRSDVTAMAVANQLPGICFVLELKYRFR